MDLPEAAVEAAFEAAVEAAIEAAFLSVGGGLGMSEGWMANPMTTGTPRRGVSR
jgi:hypothetical protein